MKTGGSLIRISAASSRDPQRHGWILWQLLVRATVSVPVGSVDKFTRERQAIVWRWGWGGRADTCSPSARVSPAESSTRNGAQGLHLARCRGSRAPGVLRQFKNMQDGGLDASPAVAGGPSRRRPQAMLSASSLPICSSCQRPYFADRQPSSRRSRYCQAGGKGAVPRLEIPGATAVDEDLMVCVNGCPVEGATA